MEEIKDSSVKSIFGAEIHQELGYWVKLGEGNRSLGTIMLDRITKVFYGSKTWDGEKEDYRITFIDKDGQEFRLKVTDLAFRKYCNSRKGKGESSESISNFLKKKFSSCDRIYFRIGLARRWEKYPDRCYLQITGIYTFPDYLESPYFNWEWTNIS